jgi:hypothetical protein
MPGLICLSALFGCNQDKGPVVQKQSVPVQVEMGEVLHSPVAHAVSQDKLLGTVTGIDALSTSNQSAFTGIVNLVPSPCPAKHRVSLAQSLADPSKSCPPVPALAARALRMIGSGAEVDAVVDALTYPEAWYPRQIDSEVPVVELWFTADAPGLLPSLAQLQALQNCRVSFQPMDVSPRSKELWDLNSICPKTNKQDLASTDMNQVEWTETIARFQELRCRPSGDSMGLEATVQKNSGLANELGVRATPTWFVNGHRLRGLQSASQLQRLIDIEQIEVGDEPE